MEVLIVQSAKEGKNRIPDFEDSANRSRFRRVYSVKDAVSAIKFLVPELVIVDVDIENGQGFRVFEDTKDVTYEKIVVSSSDSGRVKSIRFDVALHLRKPLKSNELHLALLSSIFKRQQHGIQRLFKEKFDSDLQVRLSQIFLPTASGVVLIPVGEIAWVEDTGDQRILNLANGKKLNSPTTMQRIRGLLRGNNFVLTHGCILVQAQQVVGFGKFEGASVAVLRSGRRLAVSYLDECRIRSLWQRTNHGIT
ncbi:MAG: hypothetical protein IPN95_26160 [Bacteroidetes bacterium]|nr:hypothetical protein [Bacteroidota bacterium]